MIKYYGIYPPGCDPHNLHGQQKAFLVYLAGIIPDQKDWALNVQYFKEKADIEDTLEVDIPQAEIDVSILHGKNLEDIKYTKLIEFKERALRELNAKFGVEEESKDTFIPNVELQKEQAESLRKRLFDLVHKKPKASEEETDKDGK